MHAGIKPRVPVYLFLDGERERSRARQWHGIAWQQPGVSTEISHARMWVA